MAFSFPFPTKKITQLPAGALPITGTEAIEVTQGGVSVQIPARAFPIATDSLVTYSGMFGSLPGSRQLVDGIGTVVNITVPNQLKIDITSAAAGLPVGVQLAALPAGQTNNFAILSTTGFIEINTAAGNVDLSGLTPGFDGQVLTISNVGANLLTILALNGGSAAANQFRFPFDTAITQNGGVTVRYSLALGKWITFG